MDGVTLDADGTLWNYENVAGWWDMTAMTSASSEISPIGSVLTNNRENGRAITLTGFAVNKTVGQKLGATAWHKAEQRLKAALAFVTTPGLLQVTDPALALQAYIRRVGPLLCKDSAASGRGAFDVLSFTVPLLAPDPRRYAQTLTTNTSLTISGSGTSTTQTITNNGDMPSPPVVTIVGPAVNPFIQNLSLSGSPFVRWAGTLGGADTLIFDLGAATVTVNGTADRGNLNSALWWQLQPGANSIKYGRASGASTSTCSLAYRDAYS
jgi:hypothetical protein